MEAFIPRFDTSDGFLSTMKTLDDIKSRNDVKGTVQKIIDKRQLPRVSSSVKGTFDRVTE